MTTPAARLDRVIRAAAIAIDGISPDATAPGGYRVSPSAKQAECQSLIDAFNPNDPAHVTAELDQGVTYDLDTERIFSALVWAIIDTYSSPATVAKYNTAKTKIVNAYKSRPWVA